MRAEWQLWADDSNVLDSKVCAEIVAAALALPEQQAVVGHGAVNETVRCSAVRWLRRLDPEFSGLFDFVLDRIHTANRAFGLDVSYLPDIQFTTYRGTASGHYDHHVDCFWLNPGTMFDRKVSLVMQLSAPADYEGGDLELDVGPKPDKALLRKQGASVVFPALVRHAVTPVTAGIRHSLVAWAEGPHWR